MTTMKSCDASIASEVHLHWRMLEKIQMPSKADMEEIQPPNMAYLRGVLVDWLVEIADEVNLQTDTLFLAVNYLDRYLSQKMVKRSELQLLGIVCLMIAIKYEELIGTVRGVEKFSSDVTDNTYSKEEILAMETEVLVSLNYDLSVPTTPCFVSLYESGGDKLEWQLANYIAELSILDYTIIGAYAPSMVAASAIYVARYILDPSERPWDSYLARSTLYRESDLYDCVKALHRICCQFQSLSTSSAIKDKYAKLKYGSVSSMYCPSSVPLQYYDRGLHVLVDYSFVVAG